MYDHVIEFRDRPGTPAVKVSEMSISDIRDVLKSGVGVDAHDPAGTTEADLVKRLEIELLIRQMGWR